MAWGRTYCTRERVREARDSRAQGARPLLHAFPNLVLALLLAIGLICQPYTISANGWHIKAERQTAQAVPAAIPAALAYLEAMAAAAGMSVSDFMLTVGIGIAATTGFNILEEEAKYGAEGSIDGLYGLVTTAEWPDWSELDETQQESWGSEANYTAAQFNAALSVFGLTESRDLYYSTGGGDLDEGSTSLAERIGALGTRWADGAITSLSDLYALSQNPLSLIQGVWGTSFGINITKKIPVGNHVAPFAYIPVYRTFSNLPSDNPPEYINPENWAAAYTGQVSKDGAITNNLWLVCRSSNDVTTPDITITEGVNGFNISASGSSSGWTDRPVADNHGQIRATSHSTGVSWPVPTGYMGRYDAGGWYFNIAYGGKYIFNGEPLDLDDVPYDYDQMPDTDGDIVNGLNYPDDGVGVTKLTPTTPWPTLFGEPKDPDNPDNPDDPDNPDNPDDPDNPDNPDDPDNPDNPDDPDNPDNPEKPENPYNPDNQTGTPEWREETTENVMPLMDIHFDRLFPFSMVASLPKLVDTVQGFMPGGDDTYKKIVIPMQWGQESQIELDLSDLAALLNMVRPFIEVLLVITVLWSVIAFWRGILTGS